MSNNKYLTPCFLIEGNNLEKINKQILSSIINNGRNINFGSSSEIKQARETHITVHIHGNAINNLIKGKIPKSCNFGQMATKEFQKSFLGLETNPKGFMYAYPELLKEYPNSNHKGIIKYIRKVIIEYEKITSDEHVMIKDTELIDVGKNTINQLEISRLMLEEDKKQNLQSNRNIGILYHPYMWDMKEKPCFNWYQVRYLGNDKVSVRILFRSHDYGDAVMPNLAGLAKVFVELVLKPNNCELIEIILTSTSAHIYEQSSEDAERTTGNKWERKITNTHGIA